jgi:cytochrome c oxidase subunit II
MIRLKPWIFAMWLALVPAAAMAEAQAPVVTATTAPVAAPAAPAVASDNAVKVAAPARMEPTQGIGMPVDGAYNIQMQVTKTGQRAEWMHNMILMPVMTIISLFVLGLLFWVVARYRKAANPVASKVSHNTFIEILWTGIPILILVGISIPSISLLLEQYKPAPASAVTIKATGNQWYWTYSYPDHGGFEIISNMLPDDKAEAGHEPPHLAADNRMVIPVHTPIKVITTSADVIHSFAVPAFWQKMDAVPGRLNETTFTVEREGVYYGQCSELCGARHGYMPIAVEVVSPAIFQQWIASKGGHMPGVKTAAEAPTAPAVVASIAKN